MPMMNSGPLEEPFWLAAASEPVASEIIERKTSAHRRLERWIRLQQFVYGLPNEYAYAVRSANHKGRVESWALVSVGEMTWFGQGRGTDRQHSLALALLETSEALSTNSAQVFFHRLGRLVARWRLPRAWTTAKSESDAREIPERLAG